MIRGFLKLLVCFGTVLSLTLALAVSVFAQSHAASPAPMTMEKPCTDHHQPVGATTWAEACASLCESADFHMVLGQASERSQGPDPVILPVTYDGAPALSLSQSRVSGALNGHDPPGLRLYLTTHRLRI